jgi:hypothetical protein
LKSTDLLPENQGLLFAPPHPENIKNETEERRTWNTRTLVLPV